MTVLRRVAISYEKGCPVRELLGEVTAAPHQNNLSGGEFCVDDHPIRIHWVADAICMAWPILAPLVFRFYFAARATSLKRNRLPLGP